MNPRFDEALREMLAYLQQRHEAMVQRLQRWCSQNSGSSNLPGLQAMANMIAVDYAQLADGAHEVFLPPYSVLDDHGGRRLQESAPLLRWDYQVEAADRVLLMIHYDTVYSPSASSNTLDTDEFPIDKAGRMVAPGAADAKGGLLVMLEALQAVRRFGLDAGIGWTAVANPDEEISSPSSSGWMAEHARQYQFGLLMEPSLPDGALVSSRKGSGNFTVVVHGRSAHSGRNPEDGRNAIVWLGKILIDIDQLNGRFTGTTVNVARFTGGSALNRVPDLAVGRFNVRALSVAAADEVTTAIHEIVHRYQQNPDYRVEIHGEFQSPPKEQTAASVELQKRVEDACAVVKREIQWKPTGGACDGSKLAAAGLPNIDTLGPKGGDLHSPTEWVDLLSLVPAAQTIATIIAQYAQRR